MGLAKTTKIKDVATILATKPGGGYIKDRETGSPRNFRHFVTSLRYVKVRSFDGNM